MLAIDTNIVIRYLTNDHSEQAPRADAGRQPVGVRRRHGDVGGRMGAAKHL